MRSFWLLPLANAYLPAAPKAKNSAWSRVPA